MQLYLQLAVFVIASAVAQANDCSIGGECPSEDEPNNDVSLLQTQHQMNALEDAGENQSAVPVPQIRWAGSQENVERVEVADSSVSELETVFIVLSDSQHYSKNLRWISDSWGKNLSSLQLLAIGDKTPEKSTRMRVEPTSCPAHSFKKGSCCKTGEAVIMAHQLMEKQQNLKWAYIVEDNSYVRPEAMDTKLKFVDPLGQALRGTLVASPGCNTNCSNGVCLKGGLALSREALKTLVGNSSSKFLDEHMQTCDLCELHGGSSLGTLAHARNINVFSDNWYWDATVGIHTAPMRKREFDSSLISAVPTALYHPIKEEGKFKFLDQLFTEQKGVAPLFLHGSLQDVEDRAEKRREHVWIDDRHSTTHCAKYNGNTVCGSNPDEVPWKLDSPADGNLETLMSAGFARIS